MKFIFYGWLVLINLIGLLLAVSDKSQAYDDRRRLPEVYFFVCAAFLGGPGVFLGLLLFWHKIRKWYFMVGLPALIAQNIITVLTIYLLFFGATALTF